MHKALAGISTISAQVRRQACPSRDYWRWQRNPAKQPNGRHQHHLTGKFKALAY
jgi:hypothetical protein